MFCNQCGSVVSGDASYCCGCGNKLPRPEENHQVASVGRPEVLHKTTSESNSNYTSKVVKFRWLLIVVVITVIAGGYWFVSSTSASPKLVEVGLTQFIPNGKLLCGFPSENAQCNILMKEVLPNGYQVCDTSMASGGDISWGGKYITSTGKPISLLLRSGRGIFLEFVPYDSIDCKGLPIKPLCPTDSSGIGNYYYSLACDVSPEAASIRQYNPYTKLSAAGGYAGEYVESHPGEESFIALMVKGDKIFYALENSVSWDDESKTYRYRRVVYKITSNGAEELYRQKVQNKQLVKLDEALPLRADLTPF